MTVLVLVVQGCEFGNMLGVWADTPKGLASADAYMTANYARAKRCPENEDSDTPRNWSDGDRWGDDYSLERETVTE